MANSMKILFTVHKILLRWQYIGHHFRLVHYLSAVLSAVVNVSQLISETLLLYIHIISYHQFLSCTLSGLATIRGVF